MSDTALEVQQTAEQQPTERATDAKVVRETEDIAPGGNVFDGKQWVNPLRDEQGRFAKVRESLARAEKKSAYVKAVIDGNVEPTEDMDPDTWAAARHAQVNNQTHKITAPDFGPDHTGEADPAKPNASTEQRVSPTEQPLTPEEAKHYENHDSMLADIAARAALDPGMRTARDGLKAAVEKNGVPSAAVDWLGHCLADTPNATDVFVTLGQNPDMVAMYAQLPPAAMRRAVLALSHHIAQGQTNAAKVTAPLKPKPPEPVGARATSSAFDVNDEKMSADEWAKQRWKQVHGK